MATVIGSTNSPNLWTFKFETSEGAYSIPNNTSPVTVKVYIGRTSTSGSYIKGADIDITVGCTGVAPKTVNYRNTDTVNIAAGGWLLIGTVTFSAVPHNADGAKIVYMTAEFTQSGASPSSGWAGDYVTLSTIPRQATITSVPKSWDDEHNPTIEFSNPAGTAVEELAACISFSGGVGGTPWVTITPVTKTEYTFNLSSAERDALRKGCLNGSTKVAVEFHLRTKLGGQTYIHSDKSSELSIINCMPTLSPSVVVTNPRSDLTGNDQTIIKYHSIVDASTGAKAYKHASIVSNAITCGSTTYYAATKTIENVSSGLFRFTASDNRGQTISDEKLMTFVEYIQLTCSQSARISIDEDEGTSAIVNLTVSGNYFNGSFGQESNELELWYRYKDVEDTSDWSTKPEDGWEAVQETIDKTDGGYSVTIPIAGLDYSKQYIFQSRAQDRLGYTDSTEYKIKTRPVFDWGDSDFNFNVPVTFSGGLGWTKITDGMDLNDITTPGLYRCEMSNTAATLKNCPFTDRAFLLEVLPNCGCTQRITEYQEHSPITLCMRNYYNYGNQNKWGDWYEYIPRQNAIAGIVNILYEKNQGRLSTIPFTDENGNATTKSGYVFHTDGYLWLKANYRSGHYVNCVLYGAEHVANHGIPLTATSGSSTDLKGNPTETVFVRKGMCVSNIDQNANPLGENALYFFPLTTL